MKKTLVIFFPTSQDTSISISKCIKKNFKDFFKYFPTTIDVFYINKKSAYIGKDTFLWGYQKSWRKWVYRNTKIYASFVIGDVYKYDFINYFKNPIREYTYDKRHVIETVPQYCPKSYICQNIQDIQASFRNITSKKKVYKLPVWQNGVSLQITNSFQEIKDPLFPCIIQEFIDTGTPVTDYRVVILNGKIIWKVLRTGKKWSLVSNVFQWGTVTNMWNYPMNHQIHKIVWEIDKYLEKKYPQRYYSIDFWVDKTQKPYIFELNSAPAVNTLSIRKHLTQYILNTYL